MRMGCHFYLLTFSLLLWDSSAAAQDSSACAGPEYRQLDFWLGHWQVFNAAGEATATSTITSILDGCGIREEFVAASGYRGTSLNQYQRASGDWLQTWIDSTGTSTLFHGRYNDESMTFMATGLTDANGEYVRRMRLHRVNAAEVQQESARSYDQGSHWIPEYQLVYRRLP